MIDIVKQTPEIYSQDSRDYQVLARLYTALFNMNKMYIDNMNVWRNNIDNKLTMLRAKTLNFSPKHSWDKDALESIVTCFKYLMRNKGTLNALKYCITILMRVNGLSGAPADPVQEGNNIIIKIPINLASLGVVEDLVSYLIPAGFTYRVYSYKLFDTGSVTDIKSTDSVLASVLENSKLGIYDGNIKSVNNQGYNWYRSIVNSLKESTEQNS